MNEKEKLDVFRASCSVYAQEKISLEDYLNSTLPLNPLQKQLYVYVQKDVEYVESVMDQILKTCGPDARVLTWLLYVEGNNQITVAEECGISRRQLQYSMTHWMHNVMKDENRHPVMNEKERMQAVKASFRMYRWEKKKLDSYKSSEGNAARKMFIRYIQKDMELTEGILSWMKANCDQKTYHMIITVLMEGKTQEETAEENHISRRQLQYHMNSVLKDAISSLFTGRYDSSES